MTIDDRLEKLTERHEALTQTVELLSFDVRRIAESVDRTAENIDRLEITVRETSRSILDLVTIVRSHETRINKLEDTVG